MEAVTIVPSTDRDGFQDLCGNDCQIFLGEWLLKPESLRFLVFILVYSLTPFFGSAELPTLPITSCSSRLKCQMRFRFIARFKHVNGLHISEWLKQIHHLP